MAKQHHYYGTPTYKTWAEMKYRCKKRSATAYKDVTYCERWDDFRNFLADMGERPKDKTLDRINPFGNYDPENCRRVDWFEQANNKRNIKRYFIDNQKLTLSQIARKYNISRSNLANKIYLQKLEMKDAVNFLLNRKGGDYHSRKTHVQ